MTLRARKQSLLGELMVPRPARRSRPASARSFFGELRSPVLPASVAAFGGGSSLQRLESLDHNGRTA